MTLMLLFQGKIVPARGPHDFGWDPVFEPDGFAETYAEMDCAIKNTISHRYKALQAFREHCMRENADTACVTDSTTDTAPDDAENTPVTKKAKLT